MYNNNSIHVTNERLSIGTSTMSYLWDHDKSSITDPRTRFQDDTIRMSHNNNITKISCAKY